MPIDFYQQPGSLPCRAVALTAALLGVELNAKEVDLDNEEHLKPAFLKLNPQHTIPTIDDNGFHLWESPLVSARQRRIPTSLFLVTEEIKITFCTKVFVIAINHESNTSHCKHIITKRNLVNMSVDLYYTPFSSPCRAVLLTAEAIGFPLNLKEIDLLAGEHMKPEFEQLNPQKTVPFLVDGDYTLAESRAIMSYLVDQYGKNSRLNPHTPTGRALVNQRLHFDIGTLYKAVQNYYYPVAFGKTDVYDPEQYKKVEGAFEILNIFLEGQEYVAGRYLTIADLAVAATVSTAEVFGFEIETYPNVAKWMEKIKSSAPGYRKANGEGVQAFKKFLEDSKKE